MESEHLNRTKSGGASPHTWIAATSSLVGTDTLRNLTLCDTAFGDGLRFLALWAFWRKHRAPGVKLHVVGFSAVQSWAELASGRVQPVGPECQPLDAELKAQWPDAVSGLHRLTFENGAVTLTLAFCPLSVALRQTDAIIDVFWLSDAHTFLNADCGVSPAGQLVRMANANAQVLSTGLDDCDALHQTLRKAGFKVQEIAQGGHSFVHGRLREDLCYTRRSALAGADVMVVGAGVAGAAIAWGLAQRGHHVKVFDPLLRASKAGAHEGHLAAAVTPYLSRDDDFRARLSRVGVARAWANWSVLDEDARPQRCGTLCLPTQGRPAVSWQDMLEHLKLPANWATWLAPGEAAEKCNEMNEQGGCYLPSGLLIRPDRLIPALLSHPRISIQAQAVVNVRKLGVGGGSVEIEDGSTYAAPVVVLANARHLGSLLNSLTEPGTLPMLERMSAVPGQISYYDAKRFNGGPACALDAAAYLLPQISGVLTAGGTYDLSQTTARVSPEGHQEIIEKLSPFLPARRPVLASKSVIKGGWAGWRAVVTGRLPVIGPLDGYHDLWLATAYGSRGLTWAALAADLIAAKLNNEPSIIERDLLFALRPR